MISPLRLAVGSHKAGSGKGCAMNVESWINGDKQITDLPNCADPMLARVVQRVNDTYCKHRDGDLLCPPCSIKVLELAHRTRGTNLLEHGFTSAQIRHIWVEIALSEARSVEHLSKSGKAKQYNDITQRLLDGTASSEDKRLAAYAYTAAYAYAYAYAAADAAAYAAAYAAADAYADAYTAAYVYADAAADADAYAYAYADELKLARAHALIDRFEQITGIRSISVENQVIEQALESMLERS